MQKLLQHVVLLHVRSMPAGALLEIPAPLPLISLPVKQDPIVGGKPPRSPILSRRSYLSPIRGRRVGGMSSLNTEQFSSRSAGRTFHE